MNHSLTSEPCSRYVPHEGQAASKPDCDGKQHEKTAWGIRGVVLAGGDEGPSLSNAVSSAEEILWRATQSLRCLIQVVMGHGLAIGTEAGVLAVRFGPRRDLQFPGEMDCTSCASWM